jgi:hypothetical protein
MQQKRVREREREREKKGKSPRVDTIDGIADGLPRRDHCGKRQQQKRRKHVEP